MHLLITMISFVATMLLIMPANTKGILCAMLAIGLGTGLIVWKKPQKDHKALSWLSLLLAGFWAVPLGLNFYIKWKSSEKLQALSSLLHIPSPVLVAAMTAAFSLCAVLFLAGAFQQAKNSLETRRGKYFLLIRDIAICLIAAILTVFLTQKLASVKPMSMGSVKFLWSIAVVFVLTLATYCITGEIKSAVLVITGMFATLSVANVYVYLFRERFIEPVDIFSLGTAMNVAGNYSLFPIPRIIIIWLALWVGVILLLFWVLPKANRPGWKERLVLAMCCVIGIGAVSVYATNLKTYHWKKEGPTYNGVILDFASKFKEISAKKPEGYSAEELEAIADEYRSDTDAGETEKTPHIIVIMDEAFSDLDVLGELNTDKEVMPFISSLKENTISGYALASVYGGNTANSEYEFLTGNSMAWLSPNAVPYQQYVRDATFSMVSYLEENYNYRSVAMHPYLASGWNRPITYQHLGFDKSLFAEDFPQQDYIRKYISDREMFETLVDVYEAQKDEPLFLFGVSMQNHGNYLYEGDNYTQSISLVGYECKYPEVEQYLSLIHETDKAVEYLVSYFKQVEEEVVIVFFGDHQPRLSEEFYKTLKKNDANTLADIQKRYMVPFFVWANYDIEEQTVACTSLNYLSSYVYEAAGIPLPAYSRFLSEMEARIPAINANGFYSAASQKHLPLDMASEEERKWLALYEQLQYNCLFDKHKRNESFFPILSEKTQ